MHSVDVRRNTNSIHVSFEARAAVGAGYEGQALRYTLLSRTNLNSGNWFPIPGYNNELIGDSMNVTHLAQAIR